MIRSESASMYDDDIDFDDFVGRMEERTGAIQTHSDRKQLRRHRDFALRAKLKERADAISKEKRRAANRAARKARKR